MAMVSTTSKKHVDKQQEAFKILESGLDKKKIEEEYIFELDNRYSTDAGAAMVAIAKLKDDTYALYAPEYLNEKQLVVFEFLLRNADENDHILVFSQRDYDAVKKYTYDKEVDVKILL